MKTMQNINNKYEFNIAVNITNVFGYLPEVKDIPQYFPPIFASLAAIDVYNNGGSALEGASLGLTSGVLLKNMCEIGMALADDVHDNPILAGELLIIGAVGAMGFMTTGGIVSIGLAAFSTTVAIATDAPYTADFVVNYSMEMATSLMVGLLVEHITDIV